MQQTSGFGGCCSRRRPGGAVCSCPARARIPLPASHSLQPGFRVTVGTPVELQQLVAADHHCCSGSMINPALRPPP